MQATGGNGEHARQAGSIYQGFRGRRGGAMLGEINVTPLVDVVLVLLLVFMITAPMMSRGVDVSLPVADQPQIPQEDRLTVSVDAKGTIFIGNAPVNLALLEDEIRGRMSGRSVQVVYLRADEALRYGKVIEVMDKIKKAGVERIGFAYVLPAERSGRR
jgi:biopolymer transport protein TolR